MGVNIHVLFSGFSGRPDFGSLGWGTVALLETEAGPVLVDAGGPSQRRQMGARLRTLGYGFTDIKTILLTHSHWDHVYNVDLFPEAELVISAAEWDFALNPPDPAVYPYTIDAVKARGPRLFRSEEKVFPGITAFLTPGHTPGCASFLMRDGAGGNCVIAGDALKNHAELSGHFHQTADAGESAASIRDIVGRADRILPGHDGWINVRAGKACPEGGNDVIFYAPEGVTMNGEAKITLHMDYPKTIDL